MSNKTLLVIALMAPLMASTSSFAQSAATPDPACMIKDADGSQKVDMTKCPDGLKVGANAATAPADSSNAAAVAPADATNNATAAAPLPAPAAGDQTKAAADATNSSTNAAKTSSDTANTDNSSTQPATDTSKMSTDAAKAPDDASATASTTPAPGSAVVSADKVTGSKVLSANDFIGKTVYSRADENLGKVHDLILSENGVQAVVLSVGGFLGLGAKDVAVSLASINITHDGNAIKLVVDATKDQLDAAPSYDPKTIISAN